MFLHLELKVFLWDSSSFASARAPGISMDQGSHPPSALSMYMLLIDELTPPPGPQLFPIGILVS